MNIAVLSQGRLSRIVVHIVVPLQFCVVDKFYPWFNLYFSNLSFAMMFEKEENTIQTKKNMAPKRI